MNKVAFVGAALAALSSTVFAAEAVKRVERGNLVMESVPEIPVELNERLNRYQQVRGASFSGWLKDGSALISTRFGETAQIHRIERPMGAGRDGPLPPPPSPSHVMTCCTL